MQCNYINEEGLGVQEVGELIECLGYCGPSSLRDVHLSCDHHVVRAVLGGQEEDAVCVGFIVQEGDPSLAEVIGVVLHLNHQVCEMEMTKIAPCSFLLSSLVISVPLICLNHHVVKAERGERVAGEIIPALKDCFLLLFLQNCFS